MSGPRDTLTLKHYPRCRSLTEGLGWAVVVLVGIIVIVVSYAPMSVWNRWKKTKSIEAQRQN